MLLPYLELPLCIGYAGTEDSKIVIGKFQPIKIMAYHEGFMPDVGMFIYHDNQPFQIALTLPEFETKIKAYWELVGNKQDFKSKLGVVR